MKLFEWQKANFEQYLPSVPGFIDYLGVVWQARTRYDVESDSLSGEESRPVNLSTQRFFDFTHDAKISSRNYVGVVQFENIRVEVYPKLFKNRSPDWRVIQQNFLFWLSYCHKIKFPFHLVDTASLDFDNILEILIFIFANYTNETLSKQPYQAFHEVTDEVSFLKGRINFPEYLRNNIIKGQYDRFTCTFQPFVYDNTFNQIVKFIARKLICITENIINKEKLNLIIFLLDDVSEVNCSVEDCSKVSLNPLYSDHESILSLCRLILSNCVMDIQNEDRNNFCFLIPMEYIFEDFIINFLKEHLAGYKYKSQASGWLAIRDKKNVFKIKNDLLINNKVIIDTKYKLRLKMDDRKGGVSQTDMYQMISYAVARNSKKVILVYPFFELAENDDIEFLIPMHSTEDIKIYIKSVNIMFTDQASAVQLITNELERLLT